MKKILFFLFALFAVGVQVASAQNQKKNKSTMSQHDRKMQYASPSDISSADFSNQHIQTIKPKSKASEQQNKEIRRIRKQEYRLRKNKGISFDSNSTSINQDSAI